MEAERRPRTLYWSNKDAILVSYVRLRLFASKEDPIGPHHFLSTVRPAAMQWSDAAPLPADGAVSERHQPV